MARQPPAPVDVDLSSEDFVARHKGPRRFGYFDMGTANHTSKGHVKSVGPVCASVVLGVKTTSASTWEADKVLIVFVNIGCGGLSVRRLANSAC